MKKVYVNWETDGEDVNLPYAVEVPETLNDEQISDWLSDQYGWLVDSWNY